MLTLVLGFCGLNILDFPQYFGFLQFGSLLCIVISALLLYIFTGLLYPFYYAPISGTSALGMAALIALKQVQIV